MPGRISNQLAAEPHQPFSTCQSMHSGDPRVVSLQLRRDPHRNSAAPAPYSL